MLLVGVLFPAAWSQPAKPASTITRVDQIRSLTPEEAAQGRPVRIRGVVTMDAKRRRIARDLHDSVGQFVAAIKMNIAVVKGEAHKMSPHAAKLLSENESMIDQISEEIRTISHLLHPPLLDEVGLPSALRWYTDGFSHRSKIQTTLEVPEQLERLPQEMEIAIFRAVQECLSNIHRHSGSTSCSVKIVPGPERLVVEIRDHGCGIPQERLATLSSSGGVGLRGMTERLRRLGGTLEIQSEKDGTTVTATLPIASKGQSSTDAA